MRYLKSIILIVIVLCFSCSESITDPNQYGSGEDYIIYQIILQDQFFESNYMLIIDDSTKSEYLDTLQVSHISEKIPSLLSETLIDYKERNKTKNKLNRIPNIKSQVFNSEIENNPENSVNVWFSKIGYDHSKTQAILTLGMIFGPEAGGGILFFLRNNEGEWNIEYIYGLWIA